MSCILIVEDDFIVRETISDALVDAGYAVAKAADGADALDQMRDHPPDAVLLDVQLGHEDGLSLAAWMRLQPKLCPIPVIAVTAHALATEQTSFLQAGCKACVSKPIDFKVLRVELQRWLNMSTR